MRKSDFLKAAACLASAVALIAGLVLVAGCGEKAEKEDSSYEEVEMTVPGEPGSEEDEEASPGVEDEETSTSSSPQEEEPPENAKSVDEQVSDAALEYVKQNFPEMSELKVVSVKVLDFAWGRVVVEPVDRSTDAAAAFLKKENGDWVVFDFGTGITAESHPEAPADLFK